MGGYFGRNLARPGSGGNHQTAGRVGVLVGGHDHSSAGGGLPTDRSLPAVHLSADFQSRGNVADYAALGEHKTALLLVEHFGFFGQLETGPLLVHLRAAQDAIGEMMLSHGLQRAFQQLAGPDASADASGGNQQLFAGHVLQLVPELVGPIEQRNVGWVLMVGEADHAADAVGRAHLVGYVVLFQAQHLPATPGQVINGGTPHAADSDNDGVEFSHWFSHLVSGFPLSREWRGG